jgi:hypothetical protein
MTVTLYFWQLDDAPMLLGGDEACFALHARSIALTAETSTPVPAVFQDRSHHLKYQPCQSPHGAG